MENIIKTKSVLEENQKIENNENKDSIKTYNNFEDDTNKKEKEKSNENYKINNQINLPSNNSTSNNFLYKSNNSQTSFPLLFK